MCVGVIFFSLGVVWPWHWTKQPITVAGDVIAERLADGASEEAQRLAEEAMTPGWRHVGTPGGQEVTCARSVGAVWREVKIWVTLHAAVEWPWPWSVLVLHWSGECGSVGQWVTWLLNQRGSLLLVRQKNMFALSLMLLRVLNQYLVQIAKFLLFVLFVGICSFPMYIDSSAQRNINLMYEYSNWRTMSE